MATKAQFATETIGLWEGQRGALYVLDMAEKAVTSAVEKGDKDFSLLAYLQVQQNTMFKVLVEGVAIAVQLLEPAQEEEIKHLKYERKRAVGKLSHIVKRIKLLKKNLYLAPE